jgi:nucleoside-diphosphate-sugar epimerase
VRDLVGALARQARVEVGVRSDAALRRAGEQADLYGAPGALRDELGWSPSIPLATTLSDTLDWWRARVAEEE